MDDLKVRIERLKDLDRSKGIQYLLNEAYDIIGNPVLLHNMEYHVIAYTENIVTDDPIWNEYVKTGTVSREMLEFYKNENFLVEAANAKKTAFLSSDKLKYERILGKLFNKDKVQIGASVMEAHKPFINNISVLFEYFCDILNEVLAEDEYYREYGQDYQEKLINSLIDKGIDDREMYAAHVESIYMNLKNYLFLAVAGMRELEPSTEMLIHLRDLLKRKQPAFKYSIYTNYIVIILSSDTEALNLYADLNELCNLFERNNIIAGVSNCFDNLFELERYYLEALSALNEGLKGGENKQIFLSTEMK